MTLVILKVTLLLALGLAGARLARRARAATRHALLASAIAASLLVPLVTMAAPRITLVVPVPDRVAALGARMPTTAGAPQVDTAPVIVPAEGQAALPAPTAPAFWTVERALVVLWALPVMAIAAIALRDLWLLRRLRRDGLPWIAAEALARQLAASAGVTRPVSLVTHEDVRTPFTIGWLRPALLMPMESADWDDAALRRALIHEIEHVRRHDWPVQLMARTACAVFWFHPLAWAAFRRLALEAERACDDAVLAVHEHTGYAEQLVDLARRATGRQPAAGLTMAARGDLAARVTAILDPMQPHGRAGARACGAAFGAALLLTAAISPLQAVATFDATAAPPAPAAGGLGSSASEQGRTGVVRGLGGEELMRAAQDEDLDRLRALIAGGADVNAAVPGDGSPLIAAARAGSLDAVRLLLAAGANPRMSVAGDGSPLIAAASGGSVAIVAELLAKGAGIDDAVPGDENPLIAASAAGHLDVVRLLVSRGADVNARVWSGTRYTGDRGEWRTALGQARSHGHDEVAAFLLTAGATR